MFCNQSRRDLKDDVAAEPRAIPGETWVGEF